LLDFGCGNGRLAVHAVPYLQQGMYVGTDIAPTFLAHAARRVELARAGSSCGVKLIHQVAEQFDLPDHSVDVACAFAPFTHMEHEDMYRYLVQFKRIVRPDGRLVISCLPMNLPDAQPIFLSEAALDPVARWQRVRNVTTSVDLVNEIAALAGWSVVHWLPGDEGQALSTTGEMRRLGQSIVVLSP
jgi:ubiquinone/menaquinone biosynthesis C-methylase UbiE